MKPLQGGSGTGIRPDVFLPETGDVTKQMI